MSTTMVTVRLDDTEKDTLRRGADRFGLPLSTFLVKAAEQVMRDGRLTLMARDPLSAAQLAFAGAAAPAGYLSDDDVLSDVLRDRYDAK